MEDKDEPVEVFIGTSWQSGQVQELLENAGITAMLKDEVMGRIDAPALSPGALGCVKVVVAREDIDRAELMIRDFGGQSGLHDEEPETPAEPTPGLAWVCAGCGEQVEAQFGACWKCGAPKP